MLILTGYVLTLFILSLFSSRIIKSDYWLGYTIACGTILVIILVRYLLFGGW